MTYRSEDQIKINISEKTLPDLNISLTWESISVVSPVKKKGAFSAEVPSKAIIHNGL